MFLGLASDGRTKWWKYLIGIGVIFAGWQVVGAIPMIVVLFSKGYLKFL